MPQEKIKYTPVAVDDMDEIFFYISRDNTLAAVTLLDKLNDRIASLANFLQLGTLSDEEYTNVKQGYRIVML